MFEGMQIQYVQSHYWKVNINSATRIKTFQIDKTAINQTNNKSEHMNIIVRTIKAIYVLARTTFPSVL